MLLYQVTLHFIGTAFIFWRSKENQQTSCLHYKRIDKLGLSCAKLKLELKLQLQY